MKTVSVSSVILAGVVSAGLVFALGYMSSFAAVKAGVGVLSAISTSLPRFYWVWAIPVCAFLSGHFPGKFKASIASLACLCAAASLLSTSFSVGGSVVVLAGAKYSVFASLLAFACLAVIMYWVIYAVYTLLEKKKCGGY